MNPIGLLSLVICTAQVSYAVDADKPEQHKPQCIGEDTLRVERTSNGWIQSAPIWMDGEPVKCVNSTAIVNGRSITDAELRDLKAQALSREFDKTDN